MTKTTGIARADGLRIARVLVTPALIVLLTALWTISPASAAPLTAGLALALAGGQTGPDAGLLTKAKGFKKFGRHRGRGFHGRGFKKFAGDGSVVIKKFSQDGSFVIVRVGRTPAHRCGHAASVSDGTGRAIVGARRTGFTFT